MEIQLSVRGTNRHLDADDLLERVGAREGFVGEMEDDVKREATREDAGLSEDVLMHNENDRLGCRNPLQDLSGE